MIIDIKKLFWEVFAEKHRPETTALCRSLCAKPIAEYQFVVLLKEGVKSRMSPNRARKLYQFLQKHDMVAEPES